MENKFGREGKHVRFDLETIDGRGNDMTPSNWNVEIRSHGTVIGEEWLSKSMTQTDYIKSIEKSIRK